MRVFVALLLFPLVLLHYDAHANFDLTLESGCHDTEFRFGCRSLTGKIIIFRAVFIPRKNYSSLRPLGISCDKRTIRSSSEDCGGHEGHRGRCHPFAPVVNKNKSDFAEALDVRHAINRRCSGLNYCSFVFEEDYDGAKWLGAGKVFIQHACVEDKNIKKTCNVNVDVVREGFAGSPGYPSYYVGDAECRWILKAPIFQRIKISFLDFSLRSIGPHESDCVDWVSVTENGLNLRKICGDLSDEIVVYSQGPTLNVTLVANSKTVFPKRGFIFHYKGVGCPSVKKPNDGYLVDRTESFVHYRCSSGHVFRDTLSRDKILRCHNENTWSGRMADCVSLTKILQEEINLLPNETAVEDPIAAASANMESSEHTRGELIHNDNDVILPIIIVLILFVGNSIVLYLIYRQRKKLVNKEAEAFKTQDAMEIKILSNATLENQKTVISTIDY